MRIPCSQQEEVARNGTLQDEQSVVDRGRDAEYHAKRDRGAGMLSGCGNHRKPASDRREHEDVLGVVMIDRSYAVQQLCQRRQRHAQHQRAPQTTLTTIDAAPSAS